MLRSPEKGENEDDRDVTPLLVSVSCCLPFHLTANILLQLNKQESQCHPDKITLKAKVFRERATIFGRQHSGFVTGLTESEKQFIFSPCKRPSVLLTWPG